ncbi:hypothetical protein [Amycolatopsis thailandensis]|uniref:hypothetical protein n=1 Tax=Amycolatopsis thailandensis TaxID=589330 RepID=UPI00142DB2FF|nr:hypothetical protein [Amycolatopsis thailandensis]
MIVLPALRGGHRTEANGLNGRGEIVGESENGKGQMHAVRWPAVTGSAEVR